jgi:hypothetical protein
MRVNTIIWDYQIAMYLLKALTTYIVAKLMGGFLIIYALSFYV